jgi:UDP-N-acetylglucosamine 1-carboxyvinyltransferase
VQSSDLRAGAALVLAGLAAEGRTEVTNIKYIDRGYEDLVGKLCTLGAQIARQAAVRKSEAPATADKLATGS